MPDLYRLKWYGALAIGTAFVLAGLFIAITRDAGGWIVVAFFSFVAAMAVHELWPEVIEGRSTSPDSVLARFPGPVNLRTPRRKQVFFLISTIVFGGCLLWITLHSDMGGVEKFLMWLGAVGCAIALPFMLLSIMRGSTLRLDSQGLEVFQGLKRSSFRWHDTGDFSVADVGALVVVFDSATTDRGAIAALNQNMIGYGGALPDTYGMEAWPLAQVLSEWRARALSNPQLPSQSSPTP